MPRTISLNPFANIEGNVHFGDVQKSGKIGREIADGQRNKLILPGGRRMRLNGNYPQKETLRKGK